MKIKGKSDVPGEEDEAMKKPAELSGGQLERVSGSGCDIVSAPGGVDAVFDGHSHEEVYDLTVRKQSEAE